MASTYSDALRLEKQGSGENDGTWGTKLNTVIDLVEEAIAGYTTVSTTAGGTVTLSTANSSTDESRHMVLKLTGSPSAAYNIEIPDKNKVYIIHNDSGETATIQTDGATTTVDIPDGSKDLVYCDGSDNVFSMIAGQGYLADIVDDTTPQLGGPLDANSNAINMAKGANVASATTPDVVTPADGNYIVITGTTQIDGFASATAGIWRWVRFADALTLTHNASSFILPGGADITTAAGDLALFISEGSGNWRCIIYSYANGQVRLDKEQQWTKPQYPSIESVSSASSINIDMSLANDFEVLNLDTDFTLNFTNIQKGQRGVIILENDGTGGYTFTAGTGVKTIHDGEGITLEGGANDYNILSYYAFDTDKVLVVNAPDPA